jgi:(E)-4-hydroxy-3-methylbut-2-enyl-diphosphate synthase
MVPIGKSTDMTKTYRSHAVQIGHLTMGGDAPVCIQSMTNTNTNHIEASVDQCIRMIERGAQMVRLTAQGKREVKSLAAIRNLLLDKGLNTPVVADIHFKPDLALDAARVVEKIRINPGNYLKGNSVDDLLPQLIQVCKKHGTAMRIGVNHGSLNDSILNRFGDTPEGMVESAMQFLRVCQKHSFDQVVVSMKSSNPRVMVQSVRLLVQRMTRERMSYPLHLGVTEAGDGVDGRIKSVVGMAPLLLEGMGDTIRVSLTEAPEEEIPVARQIVALFPRPSQLPYSPYENLAWDPFRFTRRSTLPILGIGHGAKVKIISSDPPEPGSDLKPLEVSAAAVSYEQWSKDPELLVKGGKFLLLEQGSNSISVVKQQLNHFCLKNTRVPVIYKSTHQTENEDHFMMQVAGHLGSLLVDGAIDAVWVENPMMMTEKINEVLLTILQAAGARISKTEYIACPSCGRTQFDIVSRLKEIREATHHLPALKIGVMGCIVNGPGEMADAQYGYVGAGPGKITLYKGREAVTRNIPEKEALQSLINLMKQEGDWIDP